MGLAQSQRLLARLTTDAALRARFAVEPAVVAAEFGLSSDDLAHLVAMPEGQLEEFARSLIRKRRGEVESLLPLTCRAIEPARFATLFARHARSYVPNGVKKHRDDAVAFADFLASVGPEPPWPGDLARLEAAALLAHDPGRRWVALRLRHRPSDLARAAIEGGSAPVPGPTLAIWFRVGRRGRVRRVVLSRPW